jgi:hypothetical protein
MGLRIEKRPESVAIEILADKQSLSEVGAAVDAYAKITTRNVGNKDSKALGEVSESNTASIFKGQWPFDTCNGD